MRVLPAVWAAAITLPASRLLPASPNRQLHARGALPVCMSSGPPPVDAPAAGMSAAGEQRKVRGGGGKRKKRQPVDPADDWGGLPAAIVASKCGAINSMIVETADAEAVLKLTVKHAHQLNSVNAATALHRIAGHLKRSRAQRDRVLRDTRFVALLDAVAELSAKSNPRSTSDTLWAFATLQHWPPTMLKPVLTQVAVHLEANAFEAQHLALTVWAFAVLELKPVRLLELIESAALAQLKYFNTQNCANMLWGFAKLNYRPAALLGPMSARLGEPTLLERMKPVEISDASYGLAVIGTREAQGEVMAALATRAQPDALLGQFSSRQLVLLTWAHARLQMKPAQLGDWVAAIQEAHERQPLLAADQKNLEAALKRFGEDTEWLHPPKVVDEEEATP